MRAQWFEIVKTVGFLYRSGVFHCFNGCKMADIGKIRDRNTPSRASFSNILILAGLRPLLVLNKLSTMYGQRFVSHRQNSSMVSSMVC